LGVDTGKSRASNEGAIKRNHLVLAPVIGVFPVLIAHRVNCHQNVCNASHAFSTHSTTKTMTEFSKGSLVEIFQKGYKGGLKPLTVQVLNLKAIPNNTGKRLRLALCDGLYNANAVIRPESVEKAEAQGIKKGSIVQLLEYKASMISPVKHVLIIDNLQVLGFQEEKINPSPTSVDQYFSNHSGESNEDLLGTSMNSPAPQEPAQKAQSHHQEDAKPKLSAQVTSKPQQTNSSTAKFPNIHAIDQLNPYQNNWTIKARVSYKSDMRKWSNQRGEGQLFNVNLLDETNEIRATAFNDVADKYYDLLQEGKVYYISKARIQPAKPQFSNLTHTYELALDRDTQIIEAEDASDVPSLHFNFVKLNKVQDLDANAIIDVIGVIKVVNPAFQIVAKSTGRPFDRRDIEVVDNTGFAITVGLWNNTALEFDIPVGSVVAFKGAKVQDFGGRSLSLTQSATIITNPDSPEAYQLKAWYDQQGGSNQEFKSLKNEVSSNSGLNTKQDIQSRKTILQAQSEELGKNDKPDYFSIKAYISYIRTENFSYPACASEGCNRKVIQQSDDTWRCEKCDVNHPKPNHRYILTLSVVDHTGQLWVTLFDDQAQQLLGQSAGELIDLKENDMSENNHAFQQVFNRIQMKEFSFRVKASPDSYKGQTRIRYNAVSLAKLDFALEADALADYFEGVKVN